MAKITREQLAGPFQSHLHPGETVQSVAFGVKQPNLLLLIGLMALAVLPGLIAVALLTKNYFVALTNRRVLVLRIKSPNLKKLEVKELVEYSRDEFPSLPAKTSEGALFTHIEIKAKERPFVAKFHRAYCPTNREDAMAIAAAVSGDTMKWPRKTEPEPR